MVVDDLVLTDFTATLMFFDEQTQLLDRSACTMARAAQDAETQRLLDELEGPVWNAAKHSYILPDCERVPDIIPANARGFIISLDAIARDMTGDYPAGDKFFIADIILVQLLSWGFLWNSRSPTRKSKPIPNGCARALRLRR